MADGVPGTGLRTSDDFIMGHLHAVRILLSFPTATLGTAGCDDERWRTHQASESQ